MTHPRGVVAPDAKGENACRILTIDGTFPDDFELPGLGKIHPAYFAPFYSTRYGEAVQLARRVGLTTPVNELPSTAAELSRKCLEFWRVKSPLTGKSS